MSHLCLESVLPKTPIFSKLFMSLSCSISSFVFICIVSVISKKKCAYQGETFQKDYYKGGGGREETIAIGRDELRYASVLKA